uniref:Uncharacterized protein n=1 Tax=Arundo donax TaxID=35708 RepID=A0A0A8YW13_ARUDO
MWRRSIGTSLLKRQRHTLADLRAIIKRNMLGSQTRSQRLSPSFSS